MWLGIDPLWEKNIGASPYNYCHGNPINMVDPDGRDEKQRTQAIDKAREYVDKNTSNNGSLYLWGAKGGPGEKVDCSGLVSNCVKAGEETDPNHGDAKGTVNMWNNTTNVEKSDIEVGNMIFFGKEGKEENIFHVGLVSNVTFDDQGNIKDLSFIASNSSTGPAKVELYKDGKTKHSYWTPKIVGYRKWDTKPDVKFASVSNVNSKTRAQSNMGINTSFSKRPLDLKGIGVRLWFNSIGR